MQPAHRLVAAVLGVMLMFWCAPGHTATLTPQQQALHVLNRLAFGPRPGDIERVLALGVDRYIEQQLHPESIPEAPDVTHALAAMSSLQLDPQEILARDVWPERSGAADPDKAALHARRAAIDHDVAAQRFQRAIFGTHQLQEVMVDFWFNHFNVFCCDKGVIVRPLVGAYELQAIRPYVLGRFRDLLGATAHHPAMLVYLDNARNLVRGDDSRLNENYARELMELHTLGADGGYTQPDVMALARILSGWRLPPAAKLELGSHGFYFDAAVHAPGDKAFLGQLIKAGGAAEGEAALDLLSQSPATARHIAFQLAQYFVADEPDPALVEALAQRFSATGGDIRAVLAALFHSPQFWDPGNTSNKFKTPFEYIVSAIRATGEPVGDAAVVADLAAGMGERLYGNATPDGYKNTADAWLSPDALMQRIVFANRLAEGQLHLQRPRVGGASPQAAMATAADMPVDAAAFRATLPGLFSAHTLGVVEREPGRLQSALLLASPEFMMR